MNRIGFIGAGNMATAIIGGLVKAQIKCEIMSYDLSNDKLENLKNKYGVISAGSCKQLSESCDYIILAVKPQNFPEVLSEIKNYINKSAVIISIAAGITPTYIIKMLEYKAKVIQVMPNTPLMLGLGATALAKEDNVSDEEFDFAEKIFSSAGIAVQIPLDKMNEVIAINGSSPAFIYEYARAFVNYGVKSGIDYDTSLKLFAQALKGSAEMLVSSGKSIDDLITMVCSKGGTTIEGISSLRENKLEDVVTDACERCTKRAYELSK